MPVKKERASHKSSMPAIPCQQFPEWKQMLSNYVKDLKEAAPTIGSHGMSREEFFESGLYRGAIEVIRGINVATTTEKRIFVARVLDHMQAVKAIKAWGYEGTRERHDYRVTLLDDRICVIEAKGCMDGNNTNIFQRPQNADEFLIWSLCQNPGADPRKNAWSGINTRLSAEMMHHKQQVDGVIIWDMLCGTKMRACPKDQGNPSRFVTIGDRSVPSPCIYLFPRTIPDPRNNKNPTCHRLSEVKFLEALWKTFGGNAGDIAEVQIEADMNGNDVVRRTTITWRGNEPCSSGWTPIKRAR